MSNLVRRFLTVTLFVLFIFNAVSSAQSNLKSTGIGLRGSFYNTSRQTAGVRTSNYIGHSVNSTVNTGGCLYVFSRLAESTLLEFSIGSIASVEEVSTYIGSNKVEVFNMMPILFGLRYDLLQSESTGFLQPYLSGGFGGYVFDDVKVINKIGLNNIETTTEVKPGLYLGGGLNIQLGSWIALNFDGKYHFVNVDPNYDHSGFEFGIGFNFSWGSFNCK